VALSTSRLSPDDSSVAALTIEQIAAVETTDLSR
jgi:hypothetical protein